MKRIMVGLMLLAALPAVASAAPRPAPVLAAFGTPAAIGEVDPDALSLLAKTSRARTDQHPGDASAWRDLARVYTLQGRFADALVAANRALAAAPGGPSRRDAALAQQRVDVARSLRHTIPHIVALEPIGPGKRWAVLSAVIGTSSSPWPQISNVRLYVVDGGRIAWQAPIVDTRLETTPINSLRMVVSGTQVMVGTVMFGASWAPASLTIYDTATLPAKPILRAVSDDPFGVESGANGWTFRNDHAIGTSLAHVEQPRWTDYYAYDRALGRWVEDDRRHPAAFTELRERIEAALKDHPDDWELLLYRGRCDEILGHPDIAAQAYKHGIEAAARQAGTDKDAARGLRFMQARCKALGS